VDDGVGLVAAVAVAAGAVVLMGVGVAGLGVDIGTITSVGTAATAAPGATAV
jgi:hypothetical protein